MGPLAAKGPFVVTPPGKRSFYCFLVASMSVGKQTPLPAGADFCPPGPTGLPSWLPKIPAKARTCLTRSARPPCWRS